MVNIQEYPNKVNTKKKKKKTKKKKNNYKNKITMQNEHKQQ